LGISERRGAEAGSLIDDRWGGPRHEPTGQRMKMRTVDVHQVRDNRIIVTGTTRTSSA
jgi:ketosteroid isomerase-like protein